LCNYEAYVTPTPSILSRRYEDDALFARALKLLEGQHRQRATMLEYLTAVTLLSHDTVPVFGHAAAMLSHLAH
jgi:hypothetical protein